MNEYVALAKAAINEFIKNKSRLSVPENLSPEFYEKSGGVFVTLRMGKDLRGCVGTYIATKNNLAEEIISSAVAACSADHRFPEIRNEELPDLAVEVSLLSEPEKISDRDMLDPKKFGVIVKCLDGRCGLLLPDLDGVDNIEDQLTIACQKGGIHFKSDEDLEIFRFKVKKYSD